MTPGKGSKYREFYDLSGRITCMHIIKKLLLASGNTQDADQLSHLSNLISAYGILCLDSNNDLTHVMKKPMFWFPTWSDTNPAAQLQKMARGLKFRI